MGALAVTKSPQLLDTAAPLVILLVRLPHNVMASVSLCFPKREEGVGKVGWERFLHYSAHSGVEESWPQQKDSTLRERSSANCKQSVWIWMIWAMMTVGPLDPGVERVHIIL